MDDVNAPSVTSTSTAAQHLADEARRRRSALGLTQEHAALRGNMPDPTYQAIEGAKRKTYRATTLNRLDRCLDWEPGTAARILATETYRPDEPDQPVVEAIGSLTSVVAQLVQAVRDLRRPPTLPEELAEIWLMLSEEDQRHIQQLALRLRNSRVHGHPNDSGAGAGD